jgi:hypothetical protein
MCSLLIRGYNNHGFEAWTVPCLYVAGKHLRTFAIKADDERNSSSGTSNENAGTTFQDDFDPESEKHQQLEDCARQLNRIFNLCLSDRYERALRLDLDSLDLIPTTHIVSGHHSRIHGSGAFTT